jgi:hypothetical protein
MKQMRRQVRRHGPRIAAKGIRYAAKRRSKRL